MQTMIKKDFLNKNTKLLGFLLISFFSISPKWILDCVKSVKKKKFKKIFYLSLVFISFEDSFEFEFSECVGDGLGLG